MIRTRHQRYDKAARAALALLRRFGAGERGATAVEFGFVALPFLFVMFAILQVAMVFWSTQVLETAVALAARQIYTGQFQNDAGNANQSTAQLAANFKQLVCNNMPAFVGSDCLTTLSIDVRNFSSFSGATAPSPVVAGVYNSSAYSYQTIGSKQIAVVTASRTLSSFVKFLPSQSGLSNGDYLLVATATFRAEPY